MTKRLIALALTLAFAAPWAAMCLAEAPGHEMACCARDQTEPEVRPCCAMSPDPAGVPVQTAAQAIEPMPAVAAFVAPIEPRRFQRDSLHASSTRPIAIRLLTSVFLI